ncbi:MAG: response regulator transcription factor [Dehalococcoidia bacterium]|nr:response regulator transcription factor [Dehalococcoidia bacterium]
MRKLSILIIDTNPFSRAGLRQTLLEQDRFEFVEVLDPASAETGHVIELVEKSLPDIVLLDINYPSLSGLELGRQIARRFPGSRVIALSGNQYENDEELLEVMKTGAVAYLMSRHCKPGDLLQTIEQACTGEYPINDLVTSRAKVARHVLRQFQHISSLSQVEQEVSTPLTPKEAEVLNLIAEGNSNKQIAGMLGISDQTIKNHVSAILRKINANYRAHAVYIAVRDGLIQAGSSS